MKRCPRYFRGSQEWPAGCRLYSCRCRYMGVAVGPTNPMIRQRNPVYPRKAPSGVCVGALCASAFLGESRRTEGVRRWERNRTSGDGRPLCPRGHSGSPKQYDEAIQILDSILKRIPGMCRRGTRSALALCYSASSMSRSRSSERVREEAPDFPFRPETTLGLTYAMLDERRGEGRVSIRAGAGSRTTKLPLKNIVWILQ